MIRRSRVILGAVLLAMTAVLSGQSQPPKTPKLPDAAGRAAAKGTQQPNRAAGPAKQAEPAPIQVNVLLPEKQAPDSDGERRYREQQIAIETSQLYVNEVLATFQFLTVIFFGWQIILTRQAIRSAEVAARASQKSADVTERALIIAERAYVEIGEWVFGGFAEDQTNFIYRFIVSGRTPATVIGGEIRLSIDAPVEVKPHLDPRFLQSIAGPQVVSQLMRPQQIVTFPGVPREAAEAWRAGQAGSQIYIGGKIWYRDAFEGTPVHVRFFSFTCAGPAATFAINQHFLLTMNYEKDEPAGEQRQEG